MASLNLETKLSIKKFFVLKCRTLLYFIVVGNMILIDGWNKQIYDFIEISIKKKFFDSGNSCNFYMYMKLQDFTYLAQDEQVKPRRLRSIGGALRRTIKDIENIYGRDNSILAELEFYAPKGRLDELQSILVGVKSNKKIVYQNEKIAHSLTEKETHSLTQKETDSLILDIFRAHNEIIKFENERLSDRAKSLLYNAQSKLVELQHSMK